MDAANPSALKLWPLEQLPALPPLRLAVVGHVEWVSLVAVEALPQAGTIAHARAFREEPAGGRFPAPQLSSTAINSYGCGDSFAACATHLGPYPS